MRKRHPVCRGRISENEGDIREGVRNLTERKRHVLGQRKVWGTDTEWGWLGKLKQIGGRKKTSKDPDNYEVWEPSSSQKLESSLTAVGQGWRRRHPYREKWKKAEAEAKHKDYSLFWRPPYLFEISAAYRPLDNLPTPSTFDRILCVFEFSELLCWLFPSPVLGFNISMLNTQPLFLLSLLNSLSKVKKILSQSDSHSQSNDIALDI